MRRGGYQPTNTELKYMFPRDGKRVCLRGVEGRAVGALQNVRKVYHEAPQNQGVSSMFEEYCAPVLYDEGVSQHLLSSMSNDVHRSKCTVDTAFQSMKKFIEHLEPSIEARGNIQDYHYKTALAMLEKKVRGKLNPIPFDELINNAKNIIPEPSASAGYPYIQCAGAHDKGTVVETSEFKDHMFDLYCTVARTKSTISQSGYSFLRSKLHPCVAYQKSAIIKPGKEDKTRLIWGYPIDMTMLEGQFAVPLIAHLQDLERFSLSAITSYTITAYSDGYKNIVDTFGPLDCTVLDYSSFDTTVPAFLIRDVFAVIKNLFVLDSVQEKMFDCVVDYFIHTPILISQTATLFVKHHGIPSGSWFTNVVGSFCNWVMMMYSHLSAGAMPVIMRVMGDDNLSVGGCMDLEYHSNTLKSFGAQINPLKCYKGKVNGATYLGRQFSNGYGNFKGWIKPGISSLLSLAFPSRPDTKVKFFQRLYCIYLDNPVSLMWNMVKYYAVDIKMALSERFDSEQNRFIIFNMFSGDTQRAKDWITGTLLSPSDLKAL